MNREELRSYNINTLDSSVFSHLLVLQMSEKQFENK